MWLLIVFFLSGAAALVYQVVWHRVLYSIYGIDITSVTVVVTAFMLGLGVGSLLGGVLSRRANHLVLPLFALSELGIGCFGFFSLDIFKWAGMLTLKVEVLAMGFVVLALVVVPTTLMGASLPLLAGNSTLVTRNVGRSVGILYFANTLGAAFGCFITAGLLLALVGLRASAHTAAALNVALGLVVLAAHRREERAA